MHNEEIWKPDIFENKALRRKSIVLFYVLFVT